MKVTSLVENTSVPGLPVEHGLSLFIELDNGKRVLFDMGQGSLFAENAEKLDCPLALVDVAVVSHGHYDHGGGLQTFLSLNNKADVYIHPLAFEGHYSLREDGLKYIGLDAELANHPRLVRCGDVQQLADGLLVFSAVDGKCCLPVGNKRLIGSDRVSADSFVHEQNLLVCEGTNLVLFAGCAHRGIVNIIRRAEDVVGRTPTHVLAGMHLVKSGLSVADEDAFIGRLADELQCFTNTKFFTMHCTGTGQFAKLKGVLGTKIGYLSCGESLSL